MGVDRLGLTRGDRVVSTVDAAGLKIGEAAWVFSDCRADLRTAESALSALPLIRHYALVVRQQVELARALNSPRPEFLWSHPSVSTTARSEERDLSWSGLLTTKAQRHQEMRNSLCLGVLVVKQSVPSAAGKSFPAGKADFFPAGWERNS